ncbi:7229_t:CDS:2, partial [Funneliformis geosporum]
GLEKQLTYLEVVSKRSKEFIIKEALVQYLENAEDVAKIYEREREKGNKKYTTKELLEELNLKEITKKKFIYKVENYLAEDPHGRGKPLKGNLKGQHRYRFINSQTPKSKVLSNLSTSLMLGFEGSLEEEPAEFREELKQEFYKWLDTSKINANAPVELKCALFDFHEILECRFEKAQKDRTNRKREYKIGSPEYNKKMQAVFQKSQEAIQSGKVNEMDDSPFNGDPQAGKTTFETIANSLSDPERDNFHF